MRFFVPAFSVSAALVAVVVSTLPSYAQAAVPLLLAAVLCSFALTRRAPWHVLPAVALTFANLPAGAAGAVVVGVVNLSVCSFALPAARRAHRSGWCVVAEATIAAAAAVSATAALNFFVVYFATAASVAVALACGALDDRAPRRVLFASAAGLLGSTVLVWPVYGETSGRTVAAAGAAVATAAVIGVLVFAAMSRRAGVLATALTVLAVSFAPTLAAAAPSPDIGDVRVSQLSPKLANLSRCVATGGDAPLAVACYANSLIDELRAGGTVASTLETVNEAFFAPPPVGPHFRNNCHETLHFLARKIAHEFEGDRRDLIRKGTDLCSAGFGHGIWEVIYADLSNDEFIAAVPTICRGWDGYNRSQDGSAGIGCRHIVGHNLASRFVGKVDTVAHYCLERDPELAAQSAELSQDETIARGNCLAGLFMEDFLDLTRNSGTRLSAAEAFSPCERPLVADNVKVAWGCYNEIGALVSPAVNFNPVAGIEMCRSQAVKAKLDDVLRFACYDSIARATVPAFDYDTDELISACSVSTDDEVRGWCAIGVGAAVMFNSNIRAEGERVCDRLASGKFLADCYIRLDEISKILATSVVEN
jgi:hypothetical protein